MKERPIIFNGEMVRAILDGRKSQTRRIVNEKWRPLVEEVLGVNGKWVFDTMEYDLTTPYGAIGDRLWVREAWAKGDGFPKKLKMFTPLRELRDAIEYRADWAEMGKEDEIRWSPSIFMLRGYSRITLEITDIRVERVQEISVEDALAEGIVHRTMNCPRMEFAQLWDSINAKRGYGWDENPWVWVIEFKKVGD